MPGCAAVGCFNSSQKGFKMKRFPKDPERRKAWAANLHRKNWQPTDYSVLCETHFHPDMWEKVRVDGKRKLKHNAIPTLFGLERHTHFVYVKPLAGIVITSSVLSKEQSRIKWNINMTPISFNSIGCPREDTKIINSFSSNRAAQSSIEDVSIDFHESKELLQSIQHYTKQIKVLRARRKKYIKAIRKLKQNVNILENESKTICL